MHHIRFFFSQYYYQQNFNPIDNKTTTTKSLRFVSPDYKWSMEVLKSLDNIYAKPDKVYIGGSFALHSYLTRNNLIKKPFEPDDLDIFVNVNSIEEFNYVSNEFIKTFEPDTISTIKYKDRINANGPLKSDETPTRDEEFHQNVIGVTSLGITLSAESPNTYKVQLVGIKKIDENQLFSTNLMSIIDQPTKVLINSNEMYHVMDLIMLACGIINDQNICVSRREKYENRGFIIKTSS